MSRRLKRKKKPTISRGDSIRFLVLVAVVAGVPIVGTIFVTAETSQPDLSELVPITDDTAGYAILNWSALRQGHSPDLTRSKIEIAAGTDVRILGYMLAGDRPLRTGERVREFILLPEAGSLMHRAHQIRDQMIAIHLDDEKGIQFSPRALTWVWGSFGVSSEPSIRSKPLYTLERARAEPANMADIQRYFK